MEHVTKFYCDTPFVKAATSGAGDLELRGYASTWGVDRDDELVSPSAFKSLEDYLSKNPILLWQHEKDKPIGTVEDAKVDKNGLAIKASVPRPEENEPDWCHLAYNKIRRGVVRTFSIGGNFHKQRQGAKRLISKVELMEISVVSVPANPDSIFECAAKAFSGETRPELSQKAVTQMMQVLGLKAITDPELAEMTPDELQERYTLLAEMYLDSGKRPPAFGDWRRVSAAVKSARRITPTSTMGDAKAATLRAGEVIDTIRAASGLVETDPVEEALVAARGKLLSAMEDAKRFDPRQLRGPDGRWIDVPGVGGGSRSGGSSSPKPSFENDKTLVVAALKPKTPEQTAALRRVGASTQGDRRFDNADMGTLLPLIDDIEDKDARAGARESLARLSMHAGARKRDPDAPKGESERRSRASIMADLDRLDSMDKFDDDVIKKGSPNAAEGARKRKAEREAERRKLNEELAGDSIYDKPSEPKRSPKPKRDPEIDDMIRGQQELDERVRREAAKVSDEQAMELAFELALNGDDVGLIGRIERWSLGRRKLTKRDVDQLENLWDTSGDEDTDVPYAARLQKLREMVGGNL